MSTELMRYTNLKRMKEEEIKGLTKRVGELVRKNEHL